jgi:hypothetical protein
MKELTGQCLVEAIRQGLDDSVSGLDWRVQTKLTGLRQQVLESGSHSSGWLGAISFSHGFVAATIATLVVGLWVLPDKHDPLIPASSSRDTVSEVQGTDVVGASAVMDVLMSGEDMEFLENLEMYEWLAEYG